MAKRKTELMDLVRGPIFKDGKKFREARNAAEDSLERLLRDLHEIHPDWALWKRVRL